MGYGRVGGSGSCGELEETLRRVLPHPHVHGTFVDLSISDHHDSLS